MNPKLFSLLLAFAVGGTVLADDIYVAREDANASDEPCDGRGTQALPYKTIQAAVTAAPVGANVWVGRGVYADEPTLSDSVPTRVVIEKSLKLESLEGRSVTHIVGAKAATETGVGEGAVRGIRVTAQDVVIKGFTIRDGAVPVDSKYGGGVCMLNSAPCRNYLVDCVISNCVAKSGGAVWRGTLAGCWLSRNVSLVTSTGPATFQCDHLNCLVTGNVDLSKRAGSNELGHALNKPGEIVNCTFAGNWGDCVFNNESGKTYALYNCLIVDNSGVRVGTKSATTTNCAFKAGIAAVSETTRHACKEDLMDYALASPMTDDWRPVVAAGVSEVGDAQWLARVELPDEDYRYIDAMGNPVPKTGAIFAGAIQQSVEPTCGCLVFSEVFSVEGLTDAATKEAAYIRPAAYPVMLKVRAKDATDANLVYYDYGGRIRPPRLDGWLCLLPPPVTVTYKKVTPKYATTVVYADAENGDDSWDGSSATHEADTLVGPKKTLQAAVDATPYGAGGYTGEDRNAEWSLVIAAGGTYDEGGAVASFLALSNRVCITENRRLRLLAPEGPEKTVIVGAPDPDTQGLGTNAMRCAAIEAPSVIQGFTMTGGYTEDNATESAGGRAGGVSGASSLSRVVADCIITNNFAGWGAGVRYLRADRCRIVGNNTKYGNGSSRTGHLVSCLLADQRGNIDTLVGGGSACYFTTIVGKVNLGSGSSFYDTLVDASAVAYSDEAYGCYSVKGFGSGTGAADCAKGPVEFADKENGCCRLPVDSPAFGTADADLSLVYLIACDDLEGNLLKFTDGKTVPGAFQRPADVVNLSVTIPAGGSVAVTGGVNGRNVLRDGATISFEHDPACGRNFLGFETDGTLVPGPSYSFVAKGDGTVTDKAVKAVYSTDWYVNPDPDTGNDANDGFTPETPKLTLKGAMSAAVISGDTVHAAKGVYKTGKMKQTAKCVSATVLDDVEIMNRVAVPSGVTLVSEEGPELTAIEGDDASEPDEHGLGSDAIRCVFLDRGATVSGFTIRNGRTRSTNTDESVDDTCAGGVLGVNLDCTVENCIVTNCIASRGGAGHTLTFRRCRIFDNTALSRGSVSRLSSFYGCVFDRQAGLHPFDYFSVISNCTLGAETTLSLAAAYSSSVVDSIILGTIGNVVPQYMSRCAYRTTSWANPIENCIRTNKTALVLDENYAPVIGQNVAIDRVPLADEPAAADEVDCYGRQRVYNGARDWGAVDADWRGVYAQALGRGLTVETASPYAATNEAGRVFLPKGELTVAWGREDAPETVHRLQAHVTGTGVLSATLNDAAEPFATVTQGDPVELSQKVAGRNTFAFDYAPGRDGGGGAELFGFKRDIGLLLLVR